MNANDHDDEMRREWLAWREVCRVLVEAGAVTEADLDAPESDPERSPGTHVLAVIREWGKRRAELWIALSAKEGTR